MIAVDKVMRALARPTVVPEHHAHLWEGPVSTSLALSIVLAVVLVILILVIREEFIDRQRGEEFERELAERRRRLERRDWRPGERVTN